MLRWERQVVYLSYAQGHPFKWVTFVIYHGGGFVSRVAIFIDGGYMDSVLRDEFGGARIDYAALSRMIVECIRPDANLFRTYYYHCLPYQGNPPTRVERERYASRKNFLDAINSLPRFEVKLGRLARRGPDARGQFYFEQKMVDVLLSIDLVRLSAKGQITDVAILAGDSDFVPAVEATKSEGVSVWLFHGNRPHDELWKLADERIKLTPEFFNKILWQP